MQKITPCLWFDTQAEAAAAFYSSIFKNTHIGKIACYGEMGAKVSGQKKDSVMTVEFVLDELQIVGLNGGPDVKFTPALSFFVWCDTEEEITELWHALSADGQVRMGLDNYPWAEKYAWTADKYGVEWQLMLSSNDHKISPAFLFVDKLFGKGEEALQFYMSLFKDSKIEFMARDEESNTIMHCVFSLAGQTFVLMEGPGEHGYGFSPAFSFVINCETQQEIDDYWNAFSAEGTIMECGWVTDKYGVAWQVVPTILRDMISDLDSKKSEKVISAMLKMKKLDITLLRDAYSS